MHYRTEEGSAFVELERGGASGPPTRVAHAEAPEEEGDVGEQVQDDRWRKVIDSCVPAVVSLKFTRPRSFDTEKAMTGQATGFVVDKELGLILTNRHVVHDGPVTTEAVFANHEIASCRAVYRDPVHDFGVFQFDPKDIKYMDLVELPLKPENAQLGTQIRVIGNNAGEKLSILAGTLARLDRPAPNTGVGCDFNTFYIQAASSTSGGSSGSPVVDGTGSAVALNAAGRMLTAVSYYLPLDRVTRALDGLRKGTPITRGTLQTVFEHQPFDELVRLGLTQGEEQKARTLASNIEGLLTVKATVPKGPGASCWCETTDKHAALESGDILLRIDGAPVSVFTELEEALDTHVGEQLMLTVARGGEILDFRVNVQDLHSITPSSYLEVGDCVLHDLSYHSAKAHHLPVGGVYVAKAGYMLRRAGVRAGTVISQVNGQPVHSAKEMCRVLASMKDGEEAHLRIFSLKSGMAVMGSAVIRVDQQWFPIRYNVRDDASTPSSGEWIRHDAPKAVAAPAEERKTKGASITQATDPVEKALAPSLVRVKCQLPYGSFSTTSSGNFIGTGLILDAGKGLVLVDRMTVPSALGDCQINFFDSIEVPGKVVAIHPIQNLAVIKYDPALIGNTPIRSATFAEGSPERGGKAWLVGMTGTERTGFAVGSWSGRIGDSRYGLTSGTENALSMNLDPLSFVGSSRSTVQDGVLVTEKGEVMGMWASVGRTSQGGETFVGIPADVITDMVAPLKESRPVEYKTLGLRLEYLSLSQLRKMGLDDETASELEAQAEKVGNLRRAVVVMQRWAHSPAMADDAFVDGDVLLAVDGQPIVTKRDVDVAIAGKTSAKVSVFRQGKRVELDAATVFDPMEDQQAGDDRVALWAGAVITEIPNLVQWLYAAPKKGVYVTSVSDGSPSQRYRLPPHCVILEMDGTPTPDLETFLKVVSSKQDGETVRIKVSSLRGQPAVTTVTLDNIYWPPTDVKLKEDGTWSRSVLDDVAGDARAGDAAESPFVVPAASA